MPRRPKRMAAVILSGVSVAGVLAACGDPVTANHDWTSTSRLFTESRVVKGVSETLTLVDGSLTGGAAAGTVVREECVRVNDGRQEPYKCLLCINAGSKVYVAAGETPSPVDSQPDEFTTLTDPARAIDVTVLGATPRSIHLKISARTHS